MFHHNLSIMLRSVKVFLALFALMLSSDSFSQIQMSYDEFRNWVQSKSPAGFSATDFNDESGSYSAMLVKGTRLVTISLNDVEQLDDDLRPLKSTGKPVEYERNGHRCVFSGGEVKVLYVQLLAINATVMLGSMDPKITRADLEKMTDDMDINSLKPLVTSANSWPAEIPAALRLDADLISVEKLEASTEGYLYEYHVLVKNNEKLVPAIRKVASECGGDISMTQYQNFTMLCGVADTMEGLREMEANEPILFVYYKGAK